MRDSVTSAAESEAAYKSAIKKALPGINEQMLYSKYSEERIVLLMIFVFIILI